MDDKLLKSFVATLSQDGTENALGQALAFSVRAQAQAEAAQQPAEPNPNDAMVFALARAANRPSNIQTRLAIAEGELEKALDWARNDPRMWSVQNEKQQKVDQLRSDLNRALVAER